MVAIKSVITLLSVCMTLCLQCLTSDIYIVPSEDGCCPGGTCYNISTFGKMADSFSNTTGLVVHFLKGTHFLDLTKLVVFTNLTNAVFKGEGSIEQGFHETVQQSTVVINCTHNSGGIAFLEGFNITIKYITICNCGVSMQRLLHRNVSLFGDSMLIAATLGLFYVGNITVDHISLQNWSAGGLVVVSSGFDLSISNSSFSNKNKMAVSDVGHVTLIYTDPLDCAPQKSTYNAAITNTNVSFGTFYYLPSKTGFYVCFTQRTYKVQLLMDSIVAYGSRNGNIWVSSSETDDPNYNLSVNNVHISYAMFGFGLIINTGSWSDVLSSINCSVNLANSNLTIFINNSVLTRNLFFNSEGYLSWNVIACQFTDIRYSVVIVIQSTEISNNEDYVGGLYFNIITYHRQSMFVNLTNVVIKNNSLSKLYHEFFPTTQQYNSISAAYVTTLRLNNVTIRDNNMTGIAVYRTNVEVSGDSGSVIHNNTGIDGGGLALYGESYLLLEDGSLLTFTNNTAQRGGAMFVDASTASLFKMHELLEPCFYQFPGNSQSRSGKVTLSGNQASIAGSVLFGSTACDLFGSLDWCDSFIGCFNKTFNYSEQHGLSVLSSEPSYVCFCESNTPNCSKDTPLNIQAYPGEVFNISLVTVGENNGVTPGTIEIQPDNPSARPELYNTTALNCTTISLTAVNMSTRYSVFPLGSSPDGGKEVNISLSRCPPAFKVSNETGVCSCGEELTITNLQDKFITCDAATNTLARQGDVWIGNINTSNHTTSECIVTQTPCPFDYCKTVRVNFTLAEPDPQCALNRTGILCGKCQDNLSLALGSNRCIECPTDQQLYLSLVLPFAVAGLGLVALLIVLDLTVSVGTINGLIFYASIIQISESTGIFFFHWSTPVLSQFIAWLNLDLGIETCFYKEMTGYQKVWLQFVFPLYIWFIIVTIIILCRYSKWLSIKIGGNIVPVLATLILLSFTKIFRTFTPALAWLSLRCANSNETKTLWYVDGDLKYLSIGHLLLLAAAVLFLLLAVPYTLALLFDPLIEKYLTRFRLFRKWWIKFKPFVDAYHGPYKDNCRFWTGLLLLVRMVFTLVSVYLDTYTTLVFITTSSSVLLSLMVFFGGIYQNNYLNVLECSSLLNLALLSAIYNPWYDTVKDTRTEVSVTIISVSIALVTFVGIIVYHVILRLQNVKCLKKCPGIKQLDCFKVKNEESERLLEDDDLVINQLAKPTRSEVWLRREPLIY